MKIVTINKVLNEERFIEGYCRNHQFCDLILIADGGSTDDTIALANKFDNVRVRPFFRQIYLEDESFMNPEPEHTNFLIEWAENEGADWLIFTGCDTWPTISLQNQARRFFDMAEKQHYSGIMLYQLYLWGDKEYFPKINEAGPALWAWKADLKLRCDENGDSFFDTVMPGPLLEDCFRLDLPFCCLHYFSDGEREKEKVKRYELWGHPKTHIMESIYAPPEPLPEGIV